MSANVDSRAERERELTSRIQQRELRVAGVGPGYVGLPLPGAGDHGTVAREGRACYLQ